MTNRIKTRTISSKRHSGKLTLRHKEMITGWVFVMPAVIGFSIFTFGSIIYSLFLSMSKWDLLNSPKFIGFENFKKILTDDYFFKYLWNTFYFVIFLVPVVIFSSLFLAMLINHKRGIFTSIYRVSLFLPSIVSTIAISMVWIWIFNPEMGLLNSLLRGVGIEFPPTWIQSSFWSKPALSIMRVWQMSGYYMILFLTGLQTIPASYYEAAEVDGATKPQQFVYITIPMLANTTFVVMILLVIEAFNMFESIFVMTDGGPNGSTSTLMFYIYEQAFSFYRMGYASAVAWVFFIIVLTVSLLQYKFRREQDGE